MNHRVRDAATLALALLLLDVSLTFDNLWPTPAIGWHGELSIEVACVLLGLALLHRIAPKAPARSAGWLSALWVALVMGRYADVTSAALYGRDINLYWDLRYIPDVAAMIVHAAHAWLVAGAVLILAVLVWLLFRLVRWTIRRAAVAVSRPGERRVVVMASAAVVLLFALQRAGVFATSDPPLFASPVSDTYARQVRFVLAARAATVGRAALPETPAFTSDLGLVRNTDVVLMFIESYGAVAYDRPAVAKPLAAERMRLEAAIKESGRSVASAFVESPTFGGSSWLAHLSLMSSVEVRDPEAYALLMAQKRQTMVSAFSGHGFRTVAMMPGLKKAWPEGGFYGFDQIYDADHLGYDGAWFGWFGIPDEFTVARVDRLELSPPSRRPVFVFLPTLSTHFPFGPTPPYQSDWQRMVSDDPYDLNVMYDALGDEPDWKNLAPSYVKAVSYAYETIGGYLRFRPDRDFVLIALGDHQPAAAVSGERASWDVPVHVIASNRLILDRLTARGFGPGLSPDRQSIGRMSTLGPMLLEALGGSPAATP